MTAAAIEVRRLYLAMLPPLSLSLMHPLYADKIRRVIRVEEPLEGRDVRRIYIYNNALQLYACRPLINFGIKVNRRSRSGFARLIPPSGALLNYSW